jgi:hypothetical protein
MKYSINEKFALHLRSNLYDKIPYFNPNDVSRSLWKSMRFQLRDILVKQLTISIEDELERYK